MGHRQKLVHKRILQAQRSQHSANPILYLVRRIQQHHAINYQYPALTVRLIRRAYMAKRPKLCASRWEILNAL